MNLNLFSEDNKIMIKMDFLLKLDDTHILNKYLINIIKVDEFMNFNYLTIIY